MKFEQLNPTAEKYYPNYAALALSRRHRLSIPAAMVTAELLGLRGPAPDPWIKAATALLDRGLRA